jgi:hypothetical protein
MQQDPRPEVLAVPPGVVSIAVRIYFTVYISSVNEELVLEDDAIRRSRASSFILLEKMS